MAIATNASTAIHKAARLVSARFPMRSSASATSADHRGLEPEKEPFHERVLLPQHVGDGQRHDREEPRQYEQSAGDQATARSMEQPADVGGQLLRLGTRKQHAIAQRMQESLFADPALLVHQDAMHDRDLPGGATKRQQPDTQPGARGLGERHGQCIQACGC